MTMYGRITWGLSLLTLVTLGVAFSVIAVSRRMFRNAVARGRLAVNVPGGLGVVATMASSWLARMPAVSISPADSSPRYSGAARASMCRRRPSSASTA